MNHASIKLSILIPVKNEGISIGIMLKFLKAVVEIPHEVLIIYDDPADDTIPVVKKAQLKYPNVRLVHNTLGKGASNAIRVGIDSAAGEYILVLAADELLPLLAIESMIKLMDALEEHPDVQNIFANFDIPDSLLEKEV